MSLPHLINPIQFGRALWPHIYFYDKQREVILSVRDNDETYVPAGNMLGKDFVAAFICLWFFLTRIPCRIVTTSAKEDHLRVLWGEIGRLIQTCKYPLSSDKGGPLVVNHQDIRKLVNGEKCPLSYLTGLVASRDSIAAMQGHHIAKTGDKVPRTLFVSDESSSVPDDYYKMASTWFNRALIIGNTWPCDNYWKRGVQGGDLPAPDGKRYRRKVIHIKAEDSPNIRLALAQQKAGMEPTGEILVPGVKDWDEYQKNLELWDPIQKTVSLKAEFYEGAEIKLYPKEWLDRADRLARILEEEKSKGLKRVAKGIGIDPGEGVANTAKASVDELGLITLESYPTPDTNVIPGEVIAFGKGQGAPPSKWVLDRGGGGKEHADTLRAQGYPVRTVSFAESVLRDYKSGIVTTEEKQDVRESKTAYKNRRAEMYGRLRNLLNPTRPGRGFAIPFFKGGVYERLRTELKVIPLIRDGEGRLELPPKQKRSADDTTVTLQDLIGFSPDEADALVLALHAMYKKSSRQQAGVG